MILSTRFTSIRRAALSLCLALSIAAFAVPARADAPPKIANPEAAAYVKQMADLMDAMAAALKAKDTTKLTDLSTKIAELGAKGETIDAKLTPEERAALEKYMAAEQKKIEEAGALDMK